MPDLLGYDRRTLASKFAAQALSAIGGAALNNISNLGWNHFNRVAMPPVWRKKFGRAFGRPKYGKRRGRRSAYRRRGRKSRPFTGRGPATMSRRRVYVKKRLNANMTRNDYDSTRERVFVGYVTASTTAPVWSPFNFRVTDMSLALAKYLDFEHYKISNIQMVITPKWGDNTESLRMYGEGDQYLYVLPRVHPDTIASTPTIQLVKTTPGVLRFSLRRNKPIVINLGAYLPRKQEYVGDTTGTVYNVEQPFFFPGWLHNPDLTTSDPSKHPKFGNCYIYCPQLESSTSARPNYTVEFYATCLLRGNRKLIDN